MPGHQFDTSTTIKTNIKFHFGQQSLGESSFEITLCFANGELQTKKT